MLYLCGNVMKPVKNIILFSATADRQVTVHFDQGTFWLSQKAMALLLGVDRTVITKHLKHIQYVQFLHILPTMAKPTKRSFIA